MTTPAADGGWEELCGALPDHATEVMTAHGGQPSPAVQSATHGVGLPAEDRGYDDYTSTEATGEDLRPARPRPIRCRWTRPRLLV